MAKVRVTVHSAPDVGRKGRPKHVEQRFSNCGPRTTSGPRVLPLWSF